MDPLQVEVFDFYAKQNAQPHNTIKYEIVQDEASATSVVRRGQPFAGAVRFTRAIDEENDVVQLVFTHAAAVNSRSQDTEAMVTLRRDSIAHKDTWSARLLDVVQDSTLMFEVSTPVSIPVGRWIVRVVTRRRDSGARLIYDYEQDLFILFNPWNPDDQTHMEDCALLQEYVLNDVGKVWVGPIQTTRGRPWVYGQFDAVVLDACMLMLDRAQIPAHQRGDPVKLSRAISRIVNSNDDDGGVLVGRWDGQYEDGVAPSEWTDSVEILYQFLQTQQSVAYGQCWVFAGVVTTVCRALGIPSRVVSNLVSAHDANSTLTVDKYYNEDMSEMDYDPTNENGADSIWNYHVWNDVWMSRPDLPPGYGGWQAIDATPQEKSSNLFQCGPAPLEAIKKGVTGVNYDVEFMLASVNADMMRWRRDPYSDTGFSVVDTNNYHIGRQILTKKPYVFDPNGDNDREDIINEYKHREGTDPERLALMNGVRRSERAKRYYAVTGSAQNEIKFKLQEIDVVKLGEDFRFTVEIENTSGEGREVNMSLTVTSVFYTGVKAGEIKKGVSKIWVGPQKRDELSILVRADDYLPKLVEYYNVKVSAMAMVMETKQAWADDDDFQFLKPTIEVSFNEDLIIGQPATAVLSFVNPLRRALTGCEFRVSSQGFEGRALRVPAPDTAPNQTVMAELPVIPNKLGNIYIVATFKSSELKHIDGAASVEVLDG